MKTIFSTPNHTIKVPTSATVGAPAVTDKKITQYAFLDRFTDAEAISIDLASIGPTVEAATIRRYLSRVGAATYIDLADPKTIASVNALEAAGRLAAGRASQILNNPIQDIERP